MLMLAHAIRRKGNRIPPRGNAPWLTYLLCDLAGDGQGIGGRYVGRMRSTTTRGVPQYADTAVFGATPATKCGLEFFPIDKIVFASDCPFDPENGSMYPRETLRILESLKLDKDTSDKIFFKNLERIAGCKLVK